MKSNHAFNVDLYATVTDLGQAHIPTEAHKALDDLLSAAQISGGGEVWLVENDTGTTYRLTFCDFTGLSICPFCQGTGAQTQPVKD